MIKGGLKITFKLDTMKLKLPILITLLSLLSFVSNAQNELHFTQFEMTPIQLNPALSGDFQGTYRIGGLYRAQWFSVVESYGNSFQTADLFVDVNVIRGFRKQDWLSVGLGYSVIDQAGSLGSNENSSGGISNNFFNMGAAYHLSNKKRTNIFTIGVQRSSVSTTSNRLVIGDTRYSIVNQALSMDGSNFNMRANMDGDLESSFSDWQFGLTYNNRGKDSEFKIGVSAARLFNPRFTLGGLRSDIDPLIAAFAEYQMPMGRSGTWIKPSLLYMTQGPANEVVVQGRVGKPMNEDLSLNGGLGLRMGDAIQVLLGADYKQYKIGASYDINISGLSAASSTIGAFELGLIYTGNINKKPKLKPILICPRL